MFFLLLTQESIEKEERGATQSKDLSGRMKRRGDRKNRRVIKQIFDQSKQVAAVQRRRAKEKGTKKKNEKIHAPTSTEVTIYGRQENRRDTHTHSRKRHDITKPHHPIKKKVKKNLEKLEKAKIKKKK